MSSSSHMSMGMDEAYCKVLRLQNSYLQALHISMFNIRDVLPFLLPLQCTYPFLSSKMSSWNASPISVLIYFILSCLCFGFWFLFCFRIVSEYLSLTFMFMFFFLHRRFSLGGLTFDSTSTIICMLLTLTPIWIFLLRNLTELFITLQTLLSFFFSFFW